MKTSHLFVKRNNEPSFCAAKLIINSIGLLIFLLGVGCAMRDKPAPIVNVTGVPPSSTSSPAQLPPAVNTSAKSAVTTDKPKLTAIDENDNEVQDVAPVKDQNLNNSLGDNVDNYIGSKNVWNMPTSGNIIQTFKQNGKGINIAGVEDQSINAIGDGKVLYSGNGLKGYGNLIIIKHDNIYLSAYAHNKTNLVKQGAAVKSGQKIATMGKNGSGKAVLHFEIRKNGKPIDPLTMIKR